MIRSGIDARAKGYADGLLTAEKMRWVGTPIGSLIKGSSYQPDGSYRAAYNDGFRRAMKDAARVEWTPPEENES